MPGNANEPSELLRRLAAGDAAAAGELGLDWSDEPLPPRPPVVREPLQITVELGDFLKKAQVGEHAKALAALRQAVQIDPTHAEALNSLPWLLLVGPRELRNAKEALPLACKAVELAPAQWHCLNTLGLALYRTGRFAEAVGVLQRSLKEGKGQSDALDLYFLAMCHARLGESGKAKDCFERAVKRQQAQKDFAPRHVEELKAFRAEAEQVLGLLGGANGRRSRARP
jgi:Tfp pilus assembly protein PilF